MRDFHWIVLIVSRARKEESILVKQKQNRARELVEIILKDYREKHIKHIKRR
jgi:hypothetical protein